MNDEPQKAGRKRSFIANCKAMCFTNAKDYARIPSQSIDTVNGIN